MRLYVIIFLTYIGLMGCGSKPNTPDSQRLDSAERPSIAPQSRFLKKHSPDEDSIRRDHALSDSITLIKKIYIQGEAQYAFIVHGKGIEEHKWLWNLFTMEDVRQEDYARQYDDLKEQFADIVPQAIHSHEEVIDGWLPVFWYQDHPYVVRSCDMYLSYQVTDSAFMTYDMDGVRPELIKSIDQSKDGIEVNTTGGSYSFVLKDPAKSIYQLTGKGQQTYVVPFRKAGALPIIIESCTMDGVGLVDYERTPSVGKSK